jgi:hypothetical protein
MNLRIIFIAVLLLVNTIAFGNLNDASPWEIPKEIKFLIYKAGNANTDQERLRILKKIQEVSGLDAEFQEKLDTLVKSIDKWTNNESIQVWSPFYPLFSKKGSEETFRTSPLYPILIFYKARWVSQYALQLGGIWGNEDRRVEELSKARKWFEEVNRSFPENRIASMYLGQPYPFEFEYYSVPGAPEWANHQRESLERLADIIVWWIDNRQNKDGSYGGGWGDDVEMWRWWMPIMIAFQHPKIEQAQKRLSNGVLNLEQMKKGYTEHITDVEHAAELTSDAITPMMFLRPEDHEWENRALRLAELMRNIWTGINQKGYLQFKSTYFSVDSVEIFPQNACATVYEARAIQPLLLYWQRTADQEVAKLLFPWLDGWVNASMSSERRKPKGVIPSAVHWPDGRVGGVEESWWDPKNYKDTTSTVYNFPSNVISVMNSLLLGWYMNNDKKYLEPIRKMADIRLEYLKMHKDESKFNEPSEGTREWVGAKLTMIAEVCAKYRFLTGSIEFDELLKHEGSNNAYAQYKVDQNLETINNSLRKMTESLRYFYPGYTSEVRWTDRVLRFPEIFTQPGIYTDPISTISPINTQLLFSMLTGEPSNGQYFPINAVRWLTPPRDIAALVKTSDFERFEAELFHFGTSPRKMEAELYLLNKGTYTLTLINKRANRILQSKKITVENKKVLIQFELPSRELCILKIE